MIWYILRWVSSLAVIFILKNDLCLVQHQCFFCCCFFNHIYSKSICQSNSVPETQKSQPYGTSGENKRLLWLIGFTKALVLLNKKIYLLEEDIFQRSRLIIGVLFCLFSERLCQMSRVKSGFFSLTYRSKCGSYYRVSYSMFSVCIQQICLVLTASFSSSISSVSCL